MTKMLRNLFTGLHTYSLFDNYYTAVVKTGVAGVPTADEARRDLERRQGTMVRLGGL